MRRSGACFCAAMAYAFTNSTAQEMRCGADFRSAAISDRSSIISAGKSGTLRAKLKPSNTRRRLTEIGTQRGLAADAFDVRINRRLFAVCIHRAGCLARLRKSGKIGSLSGTSSGRFPAVCSQEWMPPPHFRRVLS